MNTYKKILTGIFALVCIWSCIQPLSYTEWILETIPVLFGIITLYFLDRNYSISNFSYTLVIIYFCLGMLPGHYGVAHVPFGDTIGQLIGSSRNMYDRLLHFSLGFLCISLFYELTLQIITRKSIWTYAIPLGIVLAFSSLYEILEWLAHLFVTAAQSITFIGSQGDLWDPSKDMAVAFIGAVLALIIVSIINSQTKVLRRSR